MTPEHLEQWKNNWLTGKPVEGPAGFEDTIDALALASQLISTATFENPPRDVDDFDVLPSLDTPLPPVLRARFDAVMGVLPKGLVQTLIVQKMHHLGFDTDPEWARDLDETLIFWPTFKWQAWTKGARYTNAKWIFEKKDIQMMVRIFKLGLPDRASAVEIVMDTYATLSASEKEMIAHMMSEGPRSEHAPLIELMQEDETNKGRTQKLVEGLSDGFEIYTTSGPQEVIDRWLDSQKRSKNIPGITTPDTIALSLALRDPKARDHLIAKGVNFKTLFENALSMERGDEYRFLIYTLVGPVEPDLVLADMISRRVTPSDINFLLAHPEIAQKMDLSAFLNGALGRGEDLSLAGFVTQGRTVALETLLKSKIWKDTLAKMEKDGAPAAQDALCVLALLVSPQDSKRFLNQSDPSMALSLGPAWSIFQFNAYLEG